MKLAREFKEGFYAPFVGDSALKIGMKHLDSMELPNGCLFIIGEIALVDVPDKSVNELGQINLTQYQAVGIAGLNSYYKLEKLASYPYVRTHEIPEFDV